MRGAFASFKMTTVELATASATATANATATTGVLRFAQDDDGGAGNGNSNRNSKRSGNSNRNATATATQQQQQPQRQQQPQPQPQPQQQLQGSFALLRMTTVERATTSASATTTTRATASYNGRQLRATTAGNCELQRQLPLIAEGGVSQAVLVWLLQSSGLVVQSMGWSGSAVACLGMAPCCLRVFSVTAAAISELTSAPESSMRPVM